MRPIVKGKNWFTKTDLVCLEQNLPSGYGQVSSRSTAMGFYDVQNLPQGFPRKHSNGSRRRKGYSGWTRAHLPVIPESVLSQTNESCLCKFDFTFHYGPLGQPVIHIPLITTLRISLILPTSSVHKPCIWTSPPSSAYFCIHVTVLGDKRKTVAAQKQAASNSRGIWLKKYCTWDATSCYLWSYTSATGGLPWLHGYGWT